MQKYENTSLVLLYSCISIINYYKSKYFFLDLCI